MKKCSVGCSPCRRARSIKERRSVAVRPPSPPRRASRALTKPTLRSIFHLSHTTRKRILFDIKSHDTGPHIDMENRRWWWLVAGVFLLAVAVASADAEVWEESEHEVLIRNARGAKNREICRYVKGAWSNCDAKTNIRSRTLTLKKGDAETCDQRKVIQKKCKKPCRYEKASWSECGANGEMVRLDKLKTNSDTKCEPVKKVTKMCNKQAKGSKDKGRRNRQ